MDDSRTSGPIPVLTFEQFERLSLPERQAYLERIRQDLAREQTEVAARVAARQGPSP